MIPPDVTSIKEAIDAEYTNIVADAHAYRRLQRGEVVDGRVLVRAEELAQLNAVLADILATTARALTEQAADLNRVSKEVMPSG